MHLISSHLSQLHQISLYFLLPSSLSPFLPTERLPILPKSQSRATLQQTIPTSLCTLTAAVPSPHSNGTNIDTNNISVVITMMVMLKAESNVVVSLQLIIPSHRSESKNNYNCSHQS